MATIVSEHYQYGHLPTGAMFRIMRLLPGDRDSRIHCELLDVSWPPPLEYEAVSYAWGDPTKKMPIVCDGRVLEVTASLSSALAHLRSPDHPRLLWADAVWSVVFYSGISVGGLRTAPTLLLKPEPCTRN